MTPSYRHKILELVRISDIVVLFCCLGISYATIFRYRAADFLNSLATHHVVQVFIETILLAWGWHIALRSSALYSSQRLVGYLKEILDTCSGSGLCTTLCFLWLLIVTWPPQRDLTSLLLVSVLFGVSSSIILVALRLFGRFLMHRLRMRGHNLRHVVIVGTNQRAASFACSLDLHPEWGYRLRGFVDERWWDEQTSDSGRRALLGGFDAMPKLLKSMPVDEVMIALPFASFYQQVSSIVELCRHHGIAVRSIGALFDREQPTRSSLSGGAIGTVTLHDESWDPWASLIKRLVDIVVSAALLAALAPVFFMVAAIVKFTSRGPVFFVQTRMGYGRRPFLIFKFRTMVQDAEMLISRVEKLNETLGPTFKLRNDPRITAVGKFLRKTSLDEIPQLINVLTGEMSLVGPRPLPLRDYEGFSEDWHRRRFSVKPGITCLWQVMGRSSIGFEEWMALDMRYIDQWSVWLDIKILLQTIPAVFRGSGAM